MLPGGQFGLEGIMYEFAVIGVILSYFIAKRFFEEDVALTASFFMAVNWLAVNMSRTWSNASWLILIGLMLGWISLEILLNKKFKLIGLLIFLFIASIQVHASVVLVIPVVLYVIFRELFNKTLSYKYVLSGTVAGVAIWVPWFIYQFNNNWQEFLQMLNEGTTLSFEGYLSNSFDWLKLFIDCFFGFDSNWGTILLTIFGLILLYFFVKQKRYPDARIMVLGLMFVSLLVGLALIVKAEFGHYLGLCLVWLVIGLSGLTVSFFSRYNSIRTRSIVICLFFLILLGNFRKWNLWSPINLRIADYEKVAEIIDSDADTDYGVYYKSVSADTYALSFKYFLKNPLVNYSNYENTKRLYVVTTSQLDHDKLIDAKLSELQSVSGKFWIYKTSYK